MTTQFKTLMKKSLKRTVEAIKEDLAAKVDAYLNYMVEEWMQDNELAIQSGLKAEITEEFLTGLRDLFIEHHIDIPEDKVDVQFFIVRRRINENLEYAPKRVQEFVPAHGTKKVNDAFEDIQNFVRDVFTLEGEYQEKKYPKNPDKCKFCPYTDKPDLCDKKND